MSEGRATAHGKMLRNASGGLEFRLGLIAFFGLRVAGIGVLGEKQGRELGLRQLEFGFGV